MDFIFSSDPDMAAEEAEILLKDYLDGYSPDDLTFLIKCRNYLIGNDIIKSNIQFSVEFLNRSPHYLNVLKSRNIQPSLQVLNILTRVLEQECYIINPQEDSVIDSLNKLIDECKLRMANRMVKEYLIN